MVVGCSQLLLQRYRAVQFADTKHKRPPVLSTRHNEQIVGAKHVATTLDPAKVLFRKINTVVGLDNRRLHKEVPEKDGQL
jgi:hypothetical protein